MKRRLKTLLLLVAIFLLPILWLLISHIVAKHALEHYKAQLRAAGEKLTIEELLPPRVPPEQNGAKLFTQAFPYLHVEGVLESNPPPDLQMVAPGKAMIGWQQPEVVFVYDPPPRTNSWEDIEHELKRYAPGLDLIRQAITRPELDFGLDYHDSSLSDSTRFSKLSSAVLLFSASAIVDLNRGDTASSVTNVHTLLMFVDEWKNERLLVSQIVRFPFAWVACAAQWEVLQATNLTDPELAMLQRDWESMELVHPLESALEMERVWDLAAIDQARATNGPAPGSSSGSAFSSSTRSGNVLDFFKDIGQVASRKASHALWRISWSYEDEQRQAQGLQVAIETIRHIETNGFFENAMVGHYPIVEWDTRIKAFASDSQTNNWLRYTLNPHMLDNFDHSGIGNAMDRLLRTEEARRTTIAAIALKRYQLRYGKWPSNLIALVPEFLSELPRDPIDGQPMRYRPNPDGTFLLYSIGSDNKDDGGDPTLVKPTKVFQWQRGRDWVWPQPATAEEVQKYYKNLQPVTN